MIDPGHGGHDAGAVGPSGLQEKELALDIARRVAALVQEELGMRVVLTRPRDQFIGLRERTALANRERADLFLSIHVNAASDGAATGTETYFLSNEATDGAARRAAEYENRLIATDAGARGAARRMSCARSCGTSRSRTSSRSPAGWRRPSRTTSTARSVARAGA